MAVELLDGTMEPAEPVRRKGKYVMFDKLRFRSRSGGERSLEKVCAAGEVGDAIATGGSGRFYLSSGGGQTGIHGVRMDDGRSAYAHYNNMEMIVLIGIAAALAVVLFRMGGDTMRLIVSVIGVLLLGAYFFMYSIRSSGKRQYDGDSAR